MSASQNNLSLILNQQDSAGVNVLNRTVGAVTCAGVVGQWTDGILVTIATPVAITLPTAIVLQLFLKNTHATAVITVTWTPQGGAANISQKLGPGGVLLLWHTVTSATAGITTLTLNPDTGNCTFDLFLGG